MPGGRKGRALFCHLEQDISEALRNVQIPVVTIAGLSFGELIAFSMATESISQWPGMGSLLLVSIFETDHAVIVTYIMLAAVI